MPHDFSGHFCIMRYDMAEIKASKDDAKLKSKDNIFP